MTDTESPRGLDTPEAGPTVPGGGPPAPGGGPPLPGGGPPVPGGTPPARRHHHHLHTRTIVVGALVLVTIGAVVGNVVAPPANTPETPTAPSIPAGIGSSTLAPGAPPNSAALARATQGAVVDINVTNAYQAVKGAGTGMVLTARGVVLTNNHVIEGETSLSVRDVGNGRTYGAIVLGYDLSHDVAVLRLTGASDLQTIAVGSSGSVTLGDGVVAIGNAQGEGGTPSHAGGKITALDQSISARDELSGTSERLTGLFETNAAIVPGYSGGPLVNTSARVIGMVTAASVGYQFGDAAAQGYAIPIATARAIATEIVAGRASDTVHVGPTPFLGVHLTNPEGSTPGALVSGVISGGPGDQAGLAAGDTITALDGVAVTSPESLLRVLLQLTPDRTVRVDYVDQLGQPHSTELTLGTGPPQ